jgi:hypothetical protein
VDPTLLIASRKTSHTARAHPVDPGEEQDAPNYDATIDDGQAIKSGDVSSANDE